MALRKWNMPCTQTNRASLGHFFKAPHSLEAPAIRSGHLGKGLTRLIGFVAGHRSYDFRVCLFSRHAGSLSVFIHRDIIERCYKVSREKLSDLSDLHPFPHVFGVSMALCASRDTKTSGFSPQLDVGDLSLAPFQPALSPGIAACCPLFVNCLGFNDSLATGVCTMLASFELSSFSAYVMHYPLRSPETIPN